MSNNSVPLISNENKYLGDVKFESIKYKALKQNEFDEVYHHTGGDEQKVSERIKNKLRTKINCMKLLVSIFPILEWLPNYNWREDFFHDFMCGITVAVLHIPQGMAYSSLGAVPPIVGIYMAVFPVIIYMCMGTSRHISMGTLSIVCLMTSKSVYTHADPRYFHPDFDKTIISQNGTSIQLSPLGLSPVEVASAVCMTVGIWHIILGLFHLGSLSVLMSDIMISGFTTGTAVLVILSQLKHVFGIKIKQHIGPFNLIYTTWDLINGLDKINFVSLLIVLILVILLIIYNDYLKSNIQKKLAFPIPIEMIVLVAGTLLSSTFDFKHRYNLSNVGNIPLGLPSPQAPPLFLVPKLILDGLLIAIIAFSINISMASILCQKKYKIDSNQELIASGVSNIFGSFFSCIPFASSLSRSLIQLQVGGKTQLASGISCCLLLLVLLFIGPFFEPLPHCVLVSIVFVAVKGMLYQVKDLKLAFSESYGEVCVWSVTFLSVCFLDIDYGLGVGVLTSLIFVIFKSQKVIVYRLGKLRHTNIYIEQELYEAATPIQGIAILKIIGNLNFINKNNVFEKLTKLSFSTKSTPQHIIVDLMAVSSIDTSTVKTFVHFYHELEEQGIQLHFVKLLEPVKKVFIKCNFFNHFPVSQLYPSVHDAVLNCIEYS